ncbi:MAG: DUF3987 domain-containing protein, partial [Lentisphaerae bacterium]|nr:DUF3987 domain-containing protein [Lentisphaerota bacterium]
PKDYSTPPQKPNPKIQTKSKSKPKWTLIDTYHYYDGAGQLQYKVDKFLVGDKKQFIPSHYKNGQWFKGIQDIQRLPYNFMAVEKAKTVFIVEGEKDVNTLTRLGLVGSCNSGGAGNWPDEITKYFKGKKIVLLPDNDKAGSLHAQDVAAKLYSIAKAIKIISLPDLAEKGDVTDWVKAGGTKERLLELVKQGKVWTPGPGGQEGADDWEKIYSLGGKILKAPVFPIFSLPTIAASYVEENAQDMQCPSDLIAIPVIITIAGVIGKNARIRPRKGRKWTERACLWGMTIASKGQMKSPALTVGTAPIEVIQEEYEAEYKAAYSIWKEAEKVVKRREKAYEKECQIAMKNSGCDGELPEKPKGLILEDEPTQREIVVNDITIEKLAELMEGSPGLTLISDELAGFLLNMSRYNTGTDRKFYLQCHSGGSYRVARITRGRQTVKDLYLNIVGGIQPPVAKQLFNNNNNEEDDGLVERFGLIAYPEKPTSWEDVKQLPDEEIEEKFHKLCADLANTD